MRRDDFKNETLRFDMLLENNMLSYKNDYDGQDVEDIFRLCRKLLRFYIEENNLANERVSEASLNPYFIESLNVFNSSKIMDYYKSLKVKLVRDPKLKENEAGLDFELNKKKNQNETLAIYLPNGKLTMSDMMGYAHEMGHVPHILNPREDFLEYSEALPFFMEYIISLKKTGNQKDALNYFLKERLPMQQEDAKDLLKIFKHINEKDQYVRLYHQQLFADCYKFIESLEFSLALIERMKDDKTAVGNEIENVLNGKSLVHVIENLDFTTDGCERVQKEFKRMSR